MKKKIIHCCELMDICVEDPRVAINYYPKSREYAILLPKSAPAVQQIFYCPWCSKKLPESVREQYFEILEKEYGLDYIDRHDHPEKIPEEFKSDAWWKKRGL